MIPDFSVMYRLRHGLFATFTGTGNSHCGLSLVIVIHAFLASKQIVIFDKKVMHLLAPDGKQIAGQLVHIYIRTFSKSRFFQNARMRKSFIHNSYLFIVHRMSDIPSEVVRKYR